MIRNIKLKLTERQKLGLLIIGLAVILSVSILPVLKRKKPSGTGPETTGVEIQDPETVAPESSKIKAYRSSSNGNAERMWSDLQDSQEDPRVCGRKQHAEGKGHHRRRDVRRHNIAAAALSGAGNDADACILQGRSAGTRRPRLSRIQNEAVL